MVPIWTQQSITKETYTETNKSDLLEDPEYLDVWFREDAELGAAGLHVRLNVVREVTL